MTGKVRLYHLASGIKCLGPGNRLVIYFQGCNRRCEGCVAPDSHSVDGGEVYKISDVLNFIENEKDRIEGVTFSGGEPFLQYGSLLRIVKGVKEIKEDLSIMIFTGYTLKELLNMKSSETTSVLSNTDILVDGPYDINLRLFNEPWRGSKNQNIYFLTDRYNLKDYEYAKRYGVEFFLSKGCFFVYGIPPYGFLERLERSLIIKGVF